MQVRLEAYKALARYSFGDLESLGVLRPLQEHSRMLLEETEASARQDCAALVTQALHFEHSIRRR